MPRSGAKGVTVKRAKVKGAKAKAKVSKVSKVSKASKATAATEHFPIDSWLAMPPAECLKAVMKHTMHAWKTAALASNGRVLAVSDRRQAVGMGLSKARTVCNSPRRLTAAQAEAMRRDPTHNPLTGRAIAPLGFTAQVLHAIAAGKSPSPSRRVEVKTKVKAKAKTKSPSPSRRVKAKAKSPSPSRHKAKA